jgi:signal transduction histidine kinase
MPCRSRRLTNPPDPESGHEAAILKRVRGAEGVAQRLEAPQYAGSAMLADAGEGSLAGSAKPLAMEHLIGLAVQLALDNAQLCAELTASRARIVAAADQARRRIERNLHDGAQQRLVALVLELRQAQAAAPSGAGQLVRWMDGVAEALTDALEELREIARGLHPAVLAQGGLRPALQALARRSAVPVKMDVRAGGRLPEPVETAAYYVVAEALTNAAKHARASAITVNVGPDAAHGMLRVAICDDGAGGADLSRGTGLIGLKDRVEALGGRIVVNSPRGAGTSLCVQLPLNAVNGLTHLP